MTEEIIRLAPQEGQQTEFLSTTADIAIFGGAAGGGKSWCMLLDPLRNVNTDGFNCVILRKTSPQIRNSGGLWDTSMIMYKNLNCTPLESKLIWKFESGANIRFGHLEYEADKYNWDGSQIVYLGFDELQHFSETQFFYMLSRNRSTCGIKPTVRATCNPDAESWLRNFIDWWIGEDGLPITERSGKIRYMTRIDGVVKWGDTKEDLLCLDEGYIEETKLIKGQYKANMGKVNNIDEEIKKEWATKLYKAKKNALEGIKSVTFIMANVEDNKILLETNPSYLANLKALPLVERERLLKGNWNIKQQAGLFFNQSWFDIVEPSDIPIEDAKDCRYWDFASTKASSKNKDPDYTVGIKIRKSGGKYFIIDVVRVRDNPAGIQKIFMQTTEMDRMIADDIGVQYMVRWEEEGGSSGKHESYRLQTLLAGYDCRGIRSTKAKELRAKPLAVQAEIGNVVLGKGEWNEAFLSELHSFPDGKHDDQVDGASGAFNELCTRYIYPSTSDVGSGSKMEAPLDAEQLSQKYLEYYENLEEDFMMGDDF